MPQLSCSNYLCLQQGSRSTFTFCSLFLQKLLCRHRLTFFFLGQLVRPPSFPFRWCKTSQLLSSPRWSQRSYVSEILSYRLPVLYPAGKVDRLPFFGANNASRVHYPRPSSPQGTKTSIFVLSKFFYLFRYSQNFAGRFE